MRRFGILNFFVFMNERFLVGVDDTDERKTHKNLLRIPIPSPSKMSAFIPFDPSSPVFPPPLFSNPSCLAEHF